MELASYDELLQQVECLKAENSNLRKELAYNSKHLNQLGNEASNMKEVITNLQDSVSEIKTTSQLGTNDNFNAADNRNDNDCQNCDNSNEVDGNKSSQLQQLERERARILQDIEAEEREKQWFISCLDRINQQLMQLSQSNGFMSPTERVVWQQLQQDAGHLQETMQQKLGSRGEIERRQEARVHSIFLIDKQMSHLCHNQKPHNDFQQVEFVSHGNENDECCGRMTTSGTQTIDMYMNARLATSPAVDEDQNMTSVYNSSWLTDRVLWHSSPSSVGGSIHSFNHDEVGSYKSGAVSYRNRNQTQQQFGSKVEMVYSLLSMLRSQDKDDMSQKLLNMSASVDSCIAMRQSGCLPLLIELLHGGDENKARPSMEIRRRAAQALHNVIRSHPDDKGGRRETRVLKLLEQVREYCNVIRDTDSGSDEEPISPEAGLANTDRYPVSAVAMLMKLSFDEDHRHTMCQLGGLQALAELIQLDYETHGNVNAQDSITMRRYAGMALTNLTFGDGTNKALLCSNRPFMRALVAQLHSPSEDLRQVTASVLRNLSWRADQASKKALRDIGAVVVLTKASMEARKESTLKSILSALWNLSAHCSMNKADICAVDGALTFLVTTLTYRSPSKTHAIVENGGGILRNISSHIAVREEYRAILREHNCLMVLLQHLRSPSLTIVSNACGTLWNLSARCVEDQQALWDLGAVSMLRNLVHSKHKMISMGSSAALKNLLQAKPMALAVSSDKVTGGSVPSLMVRKQKALEEELDHNLAETCENLDSPKTSPTHHVADRKSNRNDRDNKNGFQPFRVTGPYQLHGRMYHSVGGQLPPGKVSRSESKDSVLTTKSDSSHDRLKSLNMLLRHRQTHPVGENDESLTEQPMQVPQVVLESRIQFVMQEVTRQIAAESGESLDNRGSRSCRFLKNSSSTAASQHIQNEAAAKNADNTLRDKFSSITSMMQKLDICDGDNEEPVNYSLKYTEEADLGIKDKEISEEVEEEKPDQNDIYSHYAETDLDDPDQLTNYSLKYTEDTDTTDAFCPPGPKEEKSPYFGTDASSMHDDTMRVYCTEDTPLNFSTATSMTDLSNIRDNKLEKSNTPAEIENKIPMNDTAVSYCVEGTPVCFSRVSSLSSLNSNPEAVMPSACKLTHNCQQEKVSLEGAPKTKSCIVTASKQNIPIQDGKTVRFDEDPLVEETPLMFSRCSSLGSLSSFDQHSIHDDRSSVISDFSRRASEVVSPSDLPDSPGETRPSTPPLPNHRSLQEPPESDEIFEDTAQTYAVEGTPLQFSNATSLSSLPISLSNFEDAKDEKVINVSNVTEVSLEDRTSDGEEDGEGDELLAACINSAMPNNTRSGASKKSNIKIVSKVNVLSNNSSAGGNQRLRSSGIPIKCNNLRNVSSSSFTSSPQFSSFETTARDNSSDGGLVLDEDKMLAQCIRSGMPRCASSKSNESKKQNYGRNLASDLSASSATATGGALMKTSTHSNKGNNESSANGINHYKENVKLSTAESKILTYDYFNKNVENTNSKEGNEKKNSKLSFNKMGFKHWNNKGNGGTKSNTNCTTDLFLVTRNKEEQESDDCHDRCRQFVVEDTPVCFSANSSLSSLSVDSCGVESTASEQALLDECIHSGMPQHTVRPTPTNKSSGLMKQRCSAKEMINKEESPSSESAADDSSSKMKDNRFQAECAGADVSLIDNIRPPSLMDDVTDMTSSSYSVTSLVSDALESKSESLNSDFVNRVLKPVAEMFNKEINGCMNTCNSNLSFYEALENVNPPSVLMEVTTDTLYEVTEVGTETVANGNDTDVEDDLPEDEGHKKAASKLLTSEEVFISPDDADVLKEDADLVVSTLKESQGLATDESLSEDMLLDCETISLVSNESDSSFTNSETPSDHKNSPRGPKIVKPVSRGAVKQLKEEEKGVGIRGRRRVSHSRQQMFVSSSMTRFSSPKPKEMLVKPTKTSALRTTQSQQKVAGIDASKKSGGGGGGGRGSNSASPNQRHKVLSGRGQAGYSENCVQPRPPIKQATFTKEKPSLASVPKISPTKTRIPTFGHVSGGKWAQSTGGNGDKSLSMDNGRASGDFNKRGQSLSPVSRNLYSSRVQQSRRTLTSNTAKSSSFSHVNSADDSDPRSGFKPPPYGSRQNQLGSPKRSTSNASLCSSTSSSTTSTSAKSADKAGAETNSRLNRVWNEGRRQTASPGNTSLPQMKRSSTYEKLDSKIVSTEEEKSSKSPTGPAAAIVPPFNYSGPKVRQPKSQIPVSTVGGNVNEQLSEEEKKQSCLVTYV